MLKRLAQFDPYQLLFPMGIIHGLVGAAIWISYAFFNTPYPGALHAHHMVSGFLISFASGFLLTAIPKFTGSPNSSPKELAFALSLSILTLVFESPIVPLVTFLFITIFALRRFASRSYAPPPHFLFLPIGILFGILGTIFQLLSSIGWLSSEYFIHGGLLLYYGTMLAFILGIGAKLVTALLGWTPLPTHQIESFQTLDSKPKADLKIYILPLFQAFIFVISFVFESNESEAPGRVLRASVATWIGFFYWRLYKLPKTRGKLPFWIWVSAWLLVIGLWTHALFPQLSVHAAHLFFIGGYGLMTLMIGSRVTLAHGGYSTEIEGRSSIYTATGCLVIIAMLTRAVSNAMPSATHHLGYAAATWVIALLSWSWYFIPKIILTRSPH